jgi:hypothetical protein
VPEDTELRAKALVCPRCGIFAAHRWFAFTPESLDGRAVPASGELSALHAARCTACTKVSLWMGSPSPDGRSATRGHMVFPAARIFGTDLPEEAPEYIADLWDQARDVAPYSAPAAAALLRVGLQQMLQDLAPDEEDLVEAVGAALPGGVPSPIYDAMDVLQLTGEEGQFAGELRLDDDEELLPSLFGLLRYIVEATYVATARALAAFEALPELRRDVEPVMIDDLMDDDDAEPQLQDAPARKPYEQLQEQLYEQSRQFEHATPLALSAIPLARDVSRFEQELGLPL